MYYPWQCLFNFFLYGLIGWMFEQCYAYLLTGKGNPQSFLYGPFKPTYAIGMSMLILINDTFSLNRSTLLLGCLIIPTMVEYLSGLILRFVFKQDYWDYSMLKYHIQGLICPYFSIIWMILSFIGVQYVQPYFITPFTDQIFSTWFVICPFICLAFVVDLGLSIFTSVKQHVMIKQFSTQEGELDGSSGTYV